MYCPSFEDCKAVCPEITLHRNKPMVGGSYVNAIIGGCLVSFERRRYPACTFTWAHAWIGGTWESLGDPWPCITPPKRELEAAIASVKQREPVVV